MADPYSKCLLLLLDFLVEEVSSFCLAGRLTYKCWPYRMLATAGRYLLNSSGLGVTASNRGKKVILSV